MSRRKQTNPNKVHWEQVIAGLEEQARQAMMKTEFSRQFAQEHPSPQQPADQDISSSDSEIDEETTLDEISSPASEEDGTLVKVKKEPEIASAGRCEEQENHFRCIQKTVYTAVLPTEVDTAFNVMYSSSSRCFILLHIFSVGLPSPFIQFSEKLPEVLNTETWSQNNNESSSSSDMKQVDLSAVYPAGILLVCNNCAAYRKLLEVQTSTVRKWAIRRQNEPLEVRLQRLERERTAKKSRRDSESTEEREMRRMRDREAKRLQRMQETDEQRSRRLQRDREAMRVKRANETPEKRQARLIREREAKRLKRRLEKMDMMLHAQFRQDSAAMAALAAEMNFF
uniref:Zinc finger protein 821 isoform X2 n=1 Tax=Geotrypetes seraphini TaxID=260995 RepID=A0A6P8REF2_GEOSA|nr:zinc finger protein 821 isoform X2 [Geotrypetes seraphini]